MIKDNFLFESSIFSKKNKNPREKDKHPELLGSNLERIKSGICKEFEETVQLELNKDICMKVKCCYDDRATNKGYGQRQEGKDPEKMESDFDTLCYNADADICTYDCCMDKMAENYLQ